jgi:hypothetical protein
MNVGELTAALEAADNRMPGERAVSALQAAWEAFAAPLKSVLDVRMQDRLDTVTRQLEERQEKEADDIHAILTELGESIRRELKPVAQLTLPGFSDTEREQYLRDLDALRHRLERIPAEIEREQGSIRARYAAYQPRLFPVAVSLLSTTTGIMRGVLQ